MKKLVLVVLDGLHYEAAQAAGWLQEMVRQNLGLGYKMKSSTPAISRPMYDHILSGQSPIVSRVNNTLCENQGGTSLFHLARRKGLTTGAAAYYWVSELYVRTPFNFINDAHQEKAEPIQNARYYMDDAYPDSHLFQDAHWLIKKHQPDFFLLHSMNIDDIGHKNGGDSSAYRNQVRNTDNALSIFLLQWLDMGYDIIVTADHGMHPDGNHSAGFPYDQYVPFFIFGSGWKRYISTEIMLEQKYLAGWISQHLGLDPTNQMQLFEHSL
ncbi:MAG: alkaline phosphatase family protein [Spirochaetia bacterium]